MRGAPDRFTMACMELASGKRTIVFFAGALLIAGCGGRVDKAGDVPPPKPLVLTLAAHPDDEQEWEPFDAAVSRLSHGTLLIKVLQRWRDDGLPQEMTYEQGMVSDIRAGKAQLGIFSARVWDTVGIDRFQALFAPFLVDSVRLEGLALQTPFASKALATVGRAGVVGIALLPGRMRRPLGVRRALVGAEDYLGARIASRPSGVAALTFRALGARPVSYIPGDISAFDGAEIDPATVSAEGFDAYARELTGNVVLWPKPWTIVMNRRAFDRLTHAQQQILLAAGRQAFDGELVRVAQDTRAAVARLCAGRLSFRAATPAQRAALVRAVRPVYDRIERDPFTKGWIAQINRMRTSAPADVARCRQN